MPSRSTKSSLSEVADSVHVDLLARTDTYVIAAWRRLLMLIWRGEANAVGIEHSRIVFDHWVKAYPRGAAFLVVVQAQHAKPPNEETREAMHKTAVSPSVGLRGMGTLILAEGFLAASVRSIMTRLNVLIGSNATNLFETPGKAADWVIQVTGDSEVSSVKLAKAIQLAQDATSGGNGSRR